MQKGNAAELAVAVLDILNRYSDREHLISMPNLLAYLSEEEIDTNRQTIYKAMNLLKDRGYEITFHKENGVQGYCIEHILSEAEAFVLLSAVQESPALSEEASKALSIRIRSLLSKPAADALSALPAAPGKQISENIMANIAALLKAIPEHHPVEFQYYDISVSHQKQYRRQNQAYHLIPYAITTDHGRFYCVFYSEKHGDFANYRIDKMDHLKVLEEKADPVMFSLEDHIRSSFQMYTGEAETITVRFAIGLANAVFDQFGSDIIISEVTKDTFTASIRTAVTPTLISWLLQFYDRTVVLHPSSLILRLQQIADTIQKTYSQGKEKL